jgi:hypothetical protein
LDWLSNLLSGIVGALAGAGIATGVLIWQRRQEQLAAGRLLYFELVGNLVLIQRAAEGEMPESKMFERETWQATRLLVGTLIHKNDLQTIIEAYRGHENWASLLRDLQNMDVDDQKRHGADLLRSAGKLFDEALHALTPYVWRGRDKDRRTID